MAGRLVVPPLLPRRERDYDREAAQSRLYEELRAKTDAELADLAGWKGPRQQMIATILTKE